MKRIILISVFFIFPIIYLQAQIKVSSSDKVGINTDNPSSVLSVSGDGNEYATTFIDNSVSLNSSRALHIRNLSTTGSYGFSLFSYTTFNSSAASTNIGMKVQCSTSSPISSKRAYGIWGIAGNATPGYNYGLYGQLYGSNNGAAVFAVVPGKGDVNIGGVYAGYFRGKVFVEDTLFYSKLFSVSDINLKKDIRLLSADGSSQVEKLQSLSAIKYKHKTPIELGQIGKEVTDTLSVSKLEIEYQSDFYTKDQIGLSAQEVKEVYPELVSRSSDGYLRMNYVDLIPVLIEATKEQQETIDNLEDKIIELQLQIKALQESKL